MSDYESDDDDRINEIQIKTSTKKTKSNGIYQRAARPMNYEENDDDDDDDDDAEKQFNRQLRLEKSEQLEKKDEKVKTKVDPDGTVYEWDPTVKGWFPKVSEEFLVEHHMNYGLESSSGIRYDVQHQTYVQQREGITYKLDNETKQWIPLDSYVDQTNQIKYQYSKKHQTWIPDRSTYSTKDEQGQELTYVWLKDQLNWSLLSSVDCYTDHLTGIKYRWNNEKQLWDNEGTEPIEDLNETTTKSSSMPSTTSKPDEKEKKKSAEGWFELPDEKNCNVYVSGLPLDMTDEEFEQLMSKYGIISPDPNDLRKKKLRLYRDENGRVKGDGRCRFVRPESVQLCIDMLDETDIRSSKIHVERAKFEVKGTFNPDLKRKRKKIDKKNQQKQMEKLFNWDDQPENLRHKFERILVFKNLFDLDQFQKDPLFIDKLRTQLRDSCSEYGEVKKINIYDGNAEGVATVGFGEIDHADQCRQYMNERIWFGRVIQCATWNGKSKFDVSVSEDAEKQRLDEWHRYLTTEDD